MDVCFHLPISLEQSSSVSSPHLNQEAYLHLVCCLFLVPTTTVAAPGDLQRPSSPRSRISYTCFPGPCRRPFSSKITKALDVPNLDRARGLPESKRGTGTTDWSRYIKVRTHRNPRGLPHSFKQLSTDFLHLERLSSFLSLLHPFFILLVLLSIRCFATHICSLSS